MHKKLITGELSPEAFVTLDREKFMNPELRKLAEAVRAESIRNSILKVDNGPRIKRTHKGEEYVVDQQPGGVPNNEAIDDSTILIPSRTPDENSKTKSANDTSQSKDVETNSVDTSANDETSTGENPHPSKASQPNLNNASGESSVITNKFKSNDIVSYSPPGSPSFAQDIDVGMDDAPEDRVFWKGRVIMDKIAQLQAQAIHLSGHSPSNFPDMEDRSKIWDYIIDKSMPLVIEGRLPRIEAGKYLKIVGTSKDVVTMLLRPEMDNKEDSSSPLGLMPEFSSLFEYFSTRDKYGVFHKTVPGLVKDAYLVTISKGEEVPSYLYLDNAGMSLLQKYLDLDKRVIVGVFVVNRRYSTPSPAPSSSSHASASSNHIPPGSNLDHTNVTLQSLGFSNTDVAMLKQLVGTNKPSSQSLASMAQQASNNNSSIKDAQKLLEILEKNYLKNQK